MKLIARDRARRSMEGILLFMVLHFPAKLLRRLRPIGTVLQLSPQ